MIWKKKHKSPITASDEEFVTNCFEWVIEAFGDQALTNKLVTIESFSNIASLKSVYSDLCDIMDIDPKKIELKTYQERRQIELGDSIVTEFSEDTKLTVGQYKEFTDGCVEIWIEDSVINNPNSLIATLSHELAHYKLLYEKRIEENDEYLTDILTILYGLGVYGANSSIVRMNSWNTGSGSGWSVKGAEGYLHSKVWAFALAYHFKILSLDKKEQEYWASTMEREIKKDFLRSLDYIKHKN